MTTFEAQGQRQSWAEERIAAPLEARQLGQVGHRGIITELCNYFIVTKKDTSALREDASTTSDSTKQTIFPVLICFLKYGCISNINILGSRIVSRSSGVMNHCDVFKYIEIKKRGS